MLALAPVDEWILRRVRAEYLEMPGLRLSPAQAQRLWGLDRSACEDLLQALTDTHFLARTKDGYFVLSSTRTLGV
jgi:hypothetical protein